MWFLVGCEIKKAVLELVLSMERLVFLLTAAGKFACSMAIKDVLLDQTEKFLASQM